MIRWRALAVALLLAAPAAGDWLVLRDGTRLETAGQWQVEGRQVVFTRPDGTLAAMRLADVDIESSSEATAADRAAAADRATAEPASATGGARRRASVLTLTDADLQPGVNESEPQVAVDESDIVEGDDDAFGNDDADNDSSEPDSAPTPEVQDDVEQPVTVVSWREQESSTVDGLEILGSVRNQGDNVAADIRVQVKVSDEDGNILVDTRSFLQRPSLGPGRSSTFRALLPGVYTLLEDPVFEVTSEGFTLGLVKESEGEEGDGYAESADDLDDYAESADDLDDYAESAEDLDDYAEPADDLDDYAADEEEGGGSGQ